MEYILLNNGKGVICSRHPEVARDTMCFDFKGAPEGSVAVFDCGEQYYRNLEGGSCNIPLKEGLFKVVVAVMTGSISGNRWVCEGIRCVQLSSGEILITPDDNDIPTRMSEIFVECDAIRARLSAVENEISGLKSFIERLMEGYDIT